MCLCTCSVGQAEEGAPVVHEQGEAVPALLCTHLKKGGGEGGGVRDGKEVGVCGCVCSTCSIEACYCIPWAREDQEWPKCGTSKALSFVLPGKAKQETLRGKEGVSMCVRACVRACTQHMTHARQT